MAFSVTRDPIALVPVGVDSHLDVHVGVALDQFGCRLGILSVPTTKAGYEELVSWAEALANWSGWEWRVLVATGPGWPASFKAGAWRWSR